MKQSLIRKLHLAGGEGLGSCFGLDANWSHGHPLRKAWCGKVNKQVSKKNMTTEKIRRS